MKLLPAVLSALTFASVGYAQQADICSTHTVASGETLRIIAEKYLGARDRSPIIYAANRSIVGSNPNLITVGMVLDIPCASGQTASAAPAAAPAAVEIIETAAAAPEVTAPAASSATRSISAASDFSGGYLALVSEAPFTGVELEGGGMMTRLIDIALQKAGSNTPPIAMSTLGMDASLDALEQNAALEVGFPVIRPNCFSPSLSDSSRRLCNDFYFSSPMFELVTALFARTSDDLQIYTADDLAGKVVCLPSFYPFEELQDLGLAMNETTMFPGTLESCFDALRDGSADLVYADFLSVNREIGELSMNMEFEALSRFTWVKTVHAIAYNGNADGSEALTMINQGLAAMIFGKEWKTILMDIMS